MKFKKIDISRIAIVTSMVSLALVYPALWMRMLANPVEYTGADFIAFYAAGRIADNEGAAQVYQLPLQKKYQQEVVMYDFALEEILPYIHPPYVVPLAQLAVIPDYLQSFQRWAVLMLFVLSLGVLFLISLTKGLFSNPEKIVFALGIFLFFPLFQSILLGQDNALVFLGTSIWMWGLFQKKDWVAGLGLALTTVRPHFTLFFLILYLFKQRMVLVWFIFFVLILVVASFAYVGIGGVEGFIRILAVSGGGEHFKTNEQNMINFIGLMRRGFPGISPVLVRKAGWVLFALALLLLGIYFGRKSGGMEGMDISMATVAGIFFSPHTHAQDMIMLIVPVMVLAFLLIKKQMVLPNRVVLLPLLISLVLLFSYFSPILTHSIPYILMSGLLVAIWHYHKNPPLVNIS